MSGKISLILGAHAHLMPSAGEDEFEALYKHKLKPFIATLNKFPKIQAALHYSGPLFSRLEQKKLELFLLVKDLVARKQLELLGGGFYEPPMFLLPLTDKIGQIEMLTTYLRQNFGRKPQGCWLARCGWEQSLVGVLTSCGMAYTFLSEAQFAAAGRPGTALHTPVFTEDQGKILMVFPVFSSLAQQDAGTIVRNAPSGLTTVFPEFPEDREEEGALAFFGELASLMADKSRDNLELTTPGKVYRSCASLPRAYFYSSCEVPGLQPRSLLIRYPEANDLYARIFFTHNLINQLRGDKSRKRAAREELWKAQGTGALYRPDFQGIGSFAGRKYAYRSILASERIIREKDFKPSLVTIDFNLNRTPEYLFQDKNINCYVRTRGAAVFELDYLPRGWNYLDTFAESEGADRRCAFMDCLLSGDFVPVIGNGAFEGFPEESRFCGNEEYAVSQVDRQKLKAAFVLPPRKGVPFGSIEIQKAYHLEKNLLHLSYALRNRGDDRMVLCFIPRFDLSFAGEGEPLLFRRSQGEEESPGEKSGVLKRVLALEERDARNGASLSLNFQLPCDLYYYPVLSGEGAYQSSCFLPVFQLFLNPGDRWDNQITLTVSARARSSKN
ncbi:MAG: DUF1926 domain-containing protein [Treponema sp.]|jgi:hypothetical protein|nr:DUF1926 domain-containing protein [Treponema sp.]